MTPADTMRAAVEALEEHARALHQQIMNLPADKKVLAQIGGSAKGFYLLGHRDARHTAAELVLASIPPNTPVEAGMVGVADGVAASQEPKENGNA